jgi:hypothetical protein
VFHWFLFIDAISLNYALENDNNGILVKHRAKRFECPSDGKWPDPQDCGK